MEIWKAQAKVMNEFDEQSIKQSFHQLTDPLIDHKIDQLPYPSINQLINHNIGLASYMDVSDTEYYYNAVHARNKSVLAWRMARLVMTSLYPTIKQSINDSIEIPLVSRGPVLWSEDQAVNQVINMLIHRTASFESQHSIFAEMIDPESSDSPTKLVVRVLFPSLIENVGIHVMSTPYCTSCCDGKSSSVISITIDQSFDHSSNPINFYHRADDLVISEFNMTAVFFIRPSVPLAFNQSIKVAINFHSFFLECALYNFARLPMLPVLRTVNIGKPVEQSVQLQQPVDTVTGQTAVQSTNQTDDHSTSHSSGQPISQENHTSSPGNFTENQESVNQTRIESVSQTFNRSFTVLTDHPVVIVIVLITLCFVWLILRRVMRQSNMQSYQALDVDDQSIDQGFDQSTGHLAHVDDSDPLIVDA